jgi:hypothetical protein
MAIKLTPGGVETISLGGLLNPTPPTLSNLGVIGPSTSGLTLSPAAYGPPAPSVTPVTAPAPVLTSAPSINVSAPTPTPMLTGATPATAATVQLPPSAAVSAPQPTQPTSTGPTKTINQDTVTKIADQLRAQYDALNQNAGYEYGGKKSDLDNMFRAQAAKLAVNGINDLSDVGERDGMLINKGTGDVIKKVNLKGEAWKQPDSTDFEFKEDVKLEDRGSFQRWGKDVSVSGQADYGINFVDGQAVMVPIWKDTKTDTGPLAAIAAVGLSLAFPGAGAAIGGALAPGASAAVQAAVGSAALAGVSTGVITGDLDKALMAAALAGGGQYLSASGTLGEAFDSLGLSEYKDTFGIQGGVPTAGGGAASALADAEFIAADAAQLAQQGLSTAQIQQTLLASGVDPVIAASAANLASSGAGYGAILQDIQGFGADTGGLFTATPSDMATFGGITSTNAGGLGLTPEQLGAIQRGEIPGSTFAEMADAAKFIIPGGAAAGGMLDNTARTVAENAAKTAATQTLAEQARGLLTNVAGAGIDYAALQQIGKEATALGREAEARAIAAGTAANVPFTPYTVTSGAGSTAFGVDPLTGRPTATVTPSEEYGALRTQALGQAGTTLGAINPAAAAESLFQRSEALAGPARQRETEQLLSSLGARGLLGVSQNLPTVGGAVAGVNPYLESLLSAQRTAQAQTALQAQQFGTQEATRQAALAQGLISTGQGIDTAAMGTLTQGANLGSLATSADQASAARQLQATLGGQALRQQYENIGLQSRAQGISGLAGVGRGLLGLPTQPGNTASQNILGNIFDEIFK